MVIIALISYVLLFQFLLIALSMVVQSIFSNSSSILEHILASFPDRVSQSDVVDVGISDHQLIYCTRKTARIKSYCQKQITFRSLKKYSPEAYEEALRKLSFPNYELTTLTKLMKTSFKRS